ncbi:hypothetical protein SAMN04488542_14038 [Fontibacillus panacisegetis]|uniref:Uncharacterized protein n=1 Tax=Fontibacillus panacisegetis TaxID=670482 RepID=A0A1G7TYT0_9BACL|nr:hypothetical protein [Fontibacillus panacisegetis]SDG40261.1 hypothetical protein SAMN04488542_14038 [Fontibacillus panacisegetis]
MKQETAKIADEISVSGMTDYEKVLAVNEYLVKKKRFARAGQFGLLNVFGSTTGDGESFAYAAGLLFFYNWNRALEESTDLKLISEIPSYLSESGEKPLRG